MRRHRSEQNRTLSQSRVHLRRQAKGRPQAAHVFSGRSRFLRILGIGPSVLIRPTIGTKAGSGARVPAPVAPGALASAFRGP